MRVDFLDERGAGRQSARRSGDAAGGRLSAARLRPGRFARYPVLYVLHGYTGDVAALLSTRPWETNVVQWADRLVRERRMPPALVVLVDGFTRLGGSQYVDSIHNGNYATYTVRDVVGHVDAHLPHDRSRRRTRRRSASRRAVSARCTS